MALPNGVLPAYHAVALPFDPDELRYGTTNTDKSFYERILARSILAGKNSLAQLQLKYLKSYLQAKVLSVLHYRDLILSIALGKLIRCVQCKDSGYIELTEHSRRFWTTFPDAKEQIWSSIPEFDTDVPYELEPGFYGVAGSLAFYLYKYEQTGEGLYPLELIEKILDLFWREVRNRQGANQPSPLLTETPKSRHDRLLVDLQCADFPFAMYERALNKLWQVPVEQQPVGARNVLKLARQGLLVPGDWDDLKQRIILGEYHTSLIPLLSALQAFTNESPTAKAFYENIPSYTSDTFDIIQSRILNLAKPGGMPFVYQAFAVESFYLVAKTLTLLPREVHALPLAEFLMSPMYEDIRLIIASQFSLAYDAYAALGFFNTLMEADGFSYRAFVSAVSFLAQNEQTELPATGDFRLDQFI